MLRSTILYAADMYYNLKEAELRQLERIEEQYMRKVLKTTKGCPITQLYLNLGQIPLRFEVQKMRCLYLKYILSQEEGSMLKKVFKLQLNHSTRGDWAHTCITDLKELRIFETLDEIKVMSEHRYATLLNNRA